ncbi:hypothetical protein ACWDA7_50480 [Streptomyces sp. NPDC001156]
MPELISPSRAIVQSGSADVVVEYGYYNVWAGGERSGADTPSRDGLLFGEAG